MSSFAWLGDNDNSFLLCHPVITPTRMRCTIQLVLSKVNCPWYKESCQLATGHSPTPVWPDLLYASVAHAQHTDSSVTMNKVYPHRTTEPSYLRMLEMALRIYIALNLTYSAPAVLPLRWKDIVYRLLSLLPYFMEKLYSKGSHHIYYYNIWPSFEDSASLYVNI